MASELDKRQVNARLAGARQTIQLLSSQVTSDEVEKDYFLARLKDLGTLLEAINEERNASSEQERLAALYEVSRLMGASLDLDEVLNQVMDAIIKLTGAERGFLMLFDEDGNLEMKAARNLEQESLQQEEFIFSRSVIRTVAESGEQVVTTNASEDPRFAGQASVVAHNLRSIQCVPLRARNKIIGVIYVDNSIRSGVFDEKDLGMLSAFAGQAAIAIENARLFTLTDEALTRRVEELQTMQEIDRQLNEQLNFSKTMSLTLEWAIRMTVADNGAIGVIDLEEGITHIIAEHGSTPDRVKAMINGSEAPHDGRVLTAPIQREGRVIGIIALDREGGKAFTDEDYQFVMRLADHAAVSIENSRLYEAISRANDAKSEFVSVMAHELRVPMTSIKGYSDMIGMVGELSDQQKGFLRVIRSNIERMGILVSDLSDMARIEAGRLNVEIEPDVSIGMVFEDMALTLQADADKREHRLILKFPRRLPAVKADPKRLSQIAINLLTNAYKYTPNGGTVTVSAKADGPFVRTFVTDTGVGMSKEELDKLFTKFWRADDSYVREQPGTGLGLAITKNLVEIMGGELFVDSEKGKGTTFSFTLPKA